MKFLEKESLFRYSMPIRGDLRYVCLFDLDFLGTGKVERIAEYIVIGKGEAFSLVKPLVIINTPKNFVGLSTADDRRLFGNFLDETFREKRGYLERVSNLLEQQIRRVLMDGAVYGRNGEEADRIWVRVPKKWKWLTDLLDSKRDEGDDFCNPPSPEKT